MYRYILLYVYDLILHFLIFISHVKFIISYVVKYILLVILQWNQNQVLCSARDSNTHLHLLLQSRSQWEVKHATINIYI